MKRFKTWMPSFVRAVLFGAVATLALSLACPANAAPPARWTDAQADGVLYQCVKAEPDWRHCACVVRKLEQYMPRVKEGQAIPDKLVEKAVKACDERRLPKAPQGGEVI